MEQVPSAEFLRSVRTALTYWQERLAHEPAPKLDPERHNLYRAVQFGLALPGTQLTAVEVAVDAFPFIYARGYWKEWLPVMERASGALLELGPTSKFWLLTRLAQLRRLNGRLKDALQAHQRALAVAKQTGEQLLLAEAHFQLGRVLRDARRYPEAKEQLQAALELGEKETRPEARLLVADAYNALGLVAHNLGQLEEAQKHLAHAVALRRKHASAVQLANGLHDLGNLHRDAGAYEEALACYDEALALFVGQGFRLDRTRLQFGIAVLHFAQQAYGRAEAVFRTIDLAFLRETGHIHMQAMILVSLGNALLYQKRFREAAEMLQESVSCWQQLEDDLELANAVGSLGEALAGLGEEAEARVKFAEALALLAPYRDDARAGRLRVLFTAEQEKLAGQEA